MKKVNYKQKKEDKMILRFTKLILTGVFCVLFFFSEQANVYAGTKTIDKEMQSILKEYLVITSDLSSDKIDRVKKATEEIIKLAEKLDVSKVTGEHAHHLKNMPENLRKAAQEMKNAKDIKDMRDVLKKLSQPMAMWASMTKPEGIYVMYCSMASGSWLQKDKKIRNPYYGAQMLECGEIVNQSEKKESESYKH